MIIINKELYKCIFRKECHIWEELNNVTKTNSIPRDRNGSFEPKVVQNYENDIYGIDIYHTLVAKITDRVLPLAQKWQNRALLA